MSHLLDEVRQRTARPGKAIVRSHYGTVTVFLNNMPDSEQDLRLLATEALKGFHRYRVFIHRRDAKLGERAVQRHWGSEKLAHGASSENRLTEPCALLSFEWKTSKQRGTTSRRLLREFLAGMGTVMAIVPLESAERSSAVRLTDEDAVFSDWCRVGHDLMMAARACFSLGESDGTRR